MAKDNRLELGRYLTNPFNEGGRIVRQLNFNDLFASKPSTGAPPWTPSRFTSTLPTSNPTTSTSYP